MLQVAHSVITLLTVFAIISHFAICARLDQPPQWTQGPSTTLQKVVRTVPSYMENMYKRHQHSWSSMTRFQPQHQPLARSSASQKSLGVVTAVRSHKYLGKHASLCAKRHCPDIIK
ncbi:hypothetical protein Ciccas_011430 [Cichlidogyrus casuarinus]|uniref:Secreted protein n=1 Tax=Cichlidogyrus casuarinus TaxID=1844966 RepID=A0ABD2PRB2_9PLAT